MNSLISVIIPVYKVEKYLDRCIQSIVDQSYHNLEIILVEDGSPDACKDICDNWSDMDQRITVLHKENGGLSDARNAGLEIAKGEWITFVDSDDYVDRHYVKYLSMLIDKYHADISVCSFYEIYETDRPMVSVGGMFEKVFGPKEAIETMLYDKDFYTCAWGKLYRSSLFDEIQYPLGKLYEDLSTTYRLLAKARTIAYGPRHLYYYVQREGSILNSKFNRKNLELIEAVERMREELRVLYPEIQDAILYRTIGAYVDTANMILEAKNKDFNKELSGLVRFIKQHKMQAMRIKNMSLAQKITVFSATLGKQCYKLNYSMQKSMKKMKERRV